MNETVTVTKKNVDELLVRLEEKCPMRFYPPASVNELETLAKRVPTLPKDYICLLEVTNGCVINESGVELYNTQKLLTEDAQVVGGIPIGIFCMGDVLVMNEKGQVYRVTFEDGEVFLAWNNLLEYLKDELYMAS